MTHRTLFRCLALALALAPVGPAALLTPAAQAQRNVVTFRGTYSAGTAYFPGDSVISGGISYVSILGGTGNNPASSLSYWTVMAAAGPAGPAGPTGPTGAAGATGPAGAPGAATVSIGTVSALSPGATPTVANSGTSSAAVLNFGIPVGIPGAGSSATVKPFAGSRLALFTDSYGDSFGYAWFPTLFAQTGFTAGYRDLESGRRTSKIFDLYDSGGDGPVVGALATALANSDAVLIELGTNDGNLATNNLGAMGDSATSGTYYGYITRAITYIQQAKPGIPILWVGPAHYNPAAYSGTAGVANGAGYIGATDPVMQQELTALRTVCAFYGVPFLDMFANSGIAPATWATYLRDGLHLTDGAYQYRWAPLISRFLAQYATTSLSGLPSTATVPSLALTIPDHITTDAPFTITATSNSSGAISYGLNGSVSGGARITGNTVTLLGATGPVYIGVAQAASGGYAATSIQTMFNVSAPGSGPISPTISFSVGSHLTTDAPFTVAATSNSSGAFTYAVTSGPATVSGSTITLTGSAGTVVLGASEAAATGYTTGTASASFAVTAPSSPIAPTITLASIPSKFTTDAPFTVSATSNSSGALTYSIASGPATISGTTVTLTGSAGTVVVGVSQASATGYTSGSTSGSFAVTVPSSSGNLFVPGTVTMDSLLVASNGTVSGVGASFYVSAEMAVTAGTTYNVLKGTGTHGNSSYAEAVWYNSSHAYISSAGSLPQVDNQNYVAPTGAAFLRISGDYGLNPTSGQSVTAGAANTLALASIGSKLTTDSAFTVSATSNSSAAITYSIVSGPATISGNTVTLTGSAGTVVVGASQSAITGYGSGSVTTSFTVTAPVTGGNLFDPSTASVGYMVFVASGALDFQGSPWYSSDFIAVTAGTAYAMGFGTGNGNPNYGIAWFDSSHAYISGVVEPFTDGQTFTAPAGAAYVRIMRDTRRGAMASQTFTAQ
jgi:lysophospholipase L1-like esterase